MTTASKGLVGGETMIREMTDPFVDLWLSPWFDSRPRLVEDEGEFSKDAVSYLVRFLYVIGHGRPGEGCGLDWY